jgi:hypothetical protein
MLRLSNTYASGFRALSFTMRHPIIDSILFAQLSNPLLLSVPSTRLLERIAVQRAPVPQIL